MDGPLRSDYGQVLRNSANYITSCSGTSTYTSCNGKWLASQQ